MLYRVLADGVVVVHAAFVGFVMLGGFLAWRWRPVVWVQLPAALWGAAIEYGGWICPLTPLENALRTRAGLEGYRGGRGEHYLIPPVYPAGLTPPSQAALGTLVVVATAMPHRAPLPPPLQHPRAPSPPP